MSIVKVSEKMKERFCKDCNIPIKIFKEPYFTERLELYDNQYNTLQKWNTFLMEYKKYASEEEYFQDYNRVKDEAISFIKETKGFHQFNSEDMNQYTYASRNISQKSIYHPDNHGKMFVSIDMKKANFSALYQYHHGIFGNKKTWEEFLSMFTDNKHILQSKYIRQVIMGNCNPKRQVTYEKYIMGLVLHQLEHILSLENCVSYSSDELVFDVTQMPEEVIHRMKEMTKQCSIIHGIEVPLSFEYFKLEKIKNTDGYIKHIIDSENRNQADISIKGLSPDILPLVLRKVYNEEITENDKVFDYNGKLACLLEIPEIILEKENDIEIERE